MFNRIMSLVGWLGTALLRQDGGRLSRRGHHEVPHLGMLGLQVDMQPQLAHCLAQRRATDAHLFGDPQLVEFLPGFQLAGQDRPPEQRDDSALSRSELLIATAALSVIGGLLIGLAPRTQLGGGDHAAA